MAGIATLTGVVVDCHDPEGLAQFWSNVLGTPVVQRIDDQYVLLSNNADIPGLAFQKVPEPRPNKNWHHLDLGVEDVDEATNAIESWGGKQLTDDQELGGHNWRVMSDPEGNQFCIGPY